MAVVNKQSNVVLIKKDEAYVGCPTFLRLSWWLGNDALPSLFSVCSERTKVQISNKLTWSLFRSAIFHPCISSKLNRKVWMIENEFWLDWHWKRFFLAPLLKEKNRFHSASFCWAAKQLFDYEIHLPQTVVFPAAWESHWIQVYTTGYEKRQE